MIGLEDLDVRRVVAGWSGAQWGLRSALVAGAAVALAATGQAASGRGPLWLPLAVVVSIWAFLSPDSTAPAVLIGLLVLGWWDRVDDPYSGWLLVFAIAVVAIHAITALAAAGPPAASIGRDVLRRWGIAVGWVLAAVVLMWVLLMLLRDSSLTASTVRLGVALLAAALLVGWLRWSSIARPSEPAPARRSDDRQ